MHAGTSTLLSIVDKSYALSHCQASARDWRPTCRQKVLVQGLVREISGATIWLEAGLFRVMQHLWKRQPRSSTSIRVFGKGNPWTLRFPLTKRRAFKRELGSTLRFPLSLPLLTSSTSTNAGPGCTSRRLARPLRQSLRSLPTPRRDPTLLDALVAEVIKQEPYVRPAVCFGSWIIDLSTAARVRPTTSNQLAFDCSGSHSGPCQLARIKWTSNFSVVQRKVPHAQRFPLAQLKEALLASFTASFPRRSVRYAPSISGLKSELNHHLP